MAYHDPHAECLKENHRSDRQPLRYLVDIKAVEELSDVSMAHLADVTDRYAFRTNDYYLSLIDWSDPADPIRRLIIPCHDELDEFGMLDASDEAANTKMQGLQHKYRDTVLLLVTDQCGGFCRYCFRKRLFLPGSREANRRVKPGLEYIRRHPEITDVLLTGGDPLTLPTTRLAQILDTLARIPHVHTIRIGSKLPAFNPYRILEDGGLQQILASHSSRAGSHLYLMCHFDHPRELTADAVRALRLLGRLGVTCVNQCPIIAGVNDDATVLAELFQSCTDAGCPQYYVFQCRPTAGNRPFKVPLVKAFSLFNRARSRLSGLSRRARYCLSHSSGKIEVVGIDDERVYARYQRARNPADEGRMLVLQRDDEATWLDELKAAE
ncbi:MAG: KamA family radical SAM protein [Actinobacteria bacterium]|nr:MAG: KamA family radical SAM protein [Actinomycetota bacterium]